MSLTQLLAILRARRWLVLPVFLAVLSLATAYALLGPRKYTAAASIVLDVRATDPLGGSQSSSVMVMSSSYVATQLDVLASERVAQRAVTRVLTSPDAALKAAFASHPSQGQPAKVAALLERGLKVEPSPDSSVLSVAVTDGNPVVAAALANGVVQGYIDTNSELRVDPAKESSSFFEDRSKEARAALEQAQARLSAYQQANGIITTDEKLGVENARLATLSDQLAAAETQAAESGSRSRRARANGSQLQESLNSAVVVGIKGDLSRQRSTLSELLSRLGEAHPQVQQTRASIAQLENRLAEETGRISGSVASDQGQVDAKVAQLRGAVAEQRKLLMTLKSKGDEAAVLERDVENTRRAYDAMIERLNKAVTESQSTQTNVHVLKVASAPDKPSWPKVPLIIALGGALGAFLALGMVLLWEAFDRRMRTSEDIATVLRQPMLGVMPASDGEPRPKLGSHSSGLALRNRTRALPEISAPATRPAQL